MDFSTFVISLGTSALYYMGVVEGPEGEDPAQMNLPLARQTVDTLEMLAEKTRDYPNGKFSAKYPEFIKGAIECLLLPSPES
jgi:hypothetical protein